MYCGVVNSKKNNDDNIHKGEAPKQQKENDLSTCRVSELNKQNINVYPII